MEILTEFVDAIPNSAGVEGHGQGVEYDGRTYYYRMPGKNIPKKRPTYLTWEGNFCGRVHGEKHYLIVCFFDDKLYRLATAHTHPQKEVEKYYGLIPIEVIKKVEQEEKEANDWVNQFPVCRNCGKTAIVLETGQPKDQCVSCFEAGLQ